MQRRPPLRGELWLAYIPGQPSDPRQPRPVLVVSENVRNRLSDDVIVVPCFSHGRIGPTRERLAAGAGGGRHDSVVFGEEITTLDVEFLSHGPLGPRVPERVMDEIIRAIRRAIGETVL